MSASLWTLLVISFVYLIVSIGIIAALFKEYTRYASLYWDLYHQYQTLLMKYSKEVGRNENKNDG